MEKEEWFKAYAARSKTTVEKLRSAGLDVYPCHCGEDGCEGWQCRNAKAAEEYYAVMGHY